MRIAVIGAGIIGVTSAYELACDGHAVTVIERRDSVASESSFANAGVIAPGYVTPWSSPGMLWKVLRQLPSRHAAIRIHGAALLTQAPWLWRWWRACKPATYAINRTAMWQLASFSRERLQELTTMLGLEYERRSGYTVLLRSDSELTQARAGLRLLADLGVKFELVDGTRCRQLEPGLNPDTPLRAAIHLPQDGVGNCRQFAQLLKALAQRLGVEFRFDTPVTDIAPGAPPTLKTAAGTETFDAILLCTGIESPRLTRPLGLKLPLTPVHGYSITAPLRHVDGYPDLGPRSALMDERYKVAISRLGQRVRVAGSAELGGTLDTMNGAAIATLYQVLDDWFPGATVAHQVQTWKGARPMLPDGPPLIGNSGREGIWINLGHGSSGWALSCGSARVVADLISRRSPPIDVARLGIERLVR